MTNDAFARPPAEVLLVIAFGPCWLTIFADRSPAASVYENDAR